MPSLSASDRILRQIFKYANRFMLLIWRLGLGNFGNRPQTSQVMVLVHRGRKSGQRRMTPVNYALIDDDVYCVAAFGAAADWVRNLAADPNVEVWLRDGWWAGVAEELPSNDPRRLHLMRQVLIASGFAAPLFAGINPKTISNPALDKLTTNYRLFCIVRTAARTGPGGPGEWAWVWPLTTSLLLVFLLWQRRSDAREG